MAHSDVINSEPYYRGILVLEGECFEVRSHRRKGVKMNAVRTVVDRGIDWMKLGMDKQKEKISNPGTDA
jgi:hypothetical protein